MKYTYKFWVCVAALILTTIGCFIVWICIDTTDDFAYSTEEFRRVLDQGGTVIISFGTDWDASWRIVNLRLTQEENWRRFFADSGTTLFIYNRTSGIFHEELFDLKNGGGEALLAIYSNRLGNRPLITVAAHLKVESVNELLELINEEVDQKGKMSLDTFEFTSTDGTYFNREIPLGAIAREP